MASNASYPDVRSMAFSRFIVLLLLIIYEYHVVSVHSRFQSCASSCCIELVAQRQHPASFMSSRSIVLLLLIVYEYHVVFMRSCHQLILVLVA